MRLDRAINERIKTINVLFVCFNSRRLDLIYLAYLLDPLSRLFCSRYHLQAVGAGGLLLGHGTRNRDRDTTRRVEFQLRLMLIDSSCYMYINLYYQSKKRRLHMSSSQGRFHRGSRGCRGGMARLCLRFRASSASLSCLQAVGISSFTALIRLARSSISVWFACTWYISKG